MRPRTSDWQLAGTSSEMNAHEARLYKVLKAILDSYENPDTLGDELFQVVGDNADAARFALSSIERRVQESR